MQLRSKRVLLLGMLGIVFVFAFYLCCHPRPSSHQPEEICFPDPRFGSLEVVFCGYQAETNGQILSWFTLTNTHPWPIRLVFLEPHSTLPDTNQPAVRIIRPCPPCVLGVQDRIGFAVTAPTNALRWRQEFIYKKATWLNTVRGDIWQRYMHRFKSTLPMEIRDMRSFFVGIDVPGVNAKSAKSNPPSMASFPRLTWYTYTYMGHHADGKGLFQTTSTNR